MSLINCGWIKFMNYYYKLNWWKKKKIKWIVIIKNKCRMLKKLLINLNFRI